MKKPVYVLIAVSLVLVLLPAAASALLANETMGGCTPGYWKQPQHEGSWVGFEPTASYSVVFGVVAGPKTLLEALQTGGGGEKALGRHAVAALLNASNPDVGYPNSVGEVLAIVQGAYNSRDFETAKNLLAVQNELDCPLGRGPTPTPTTPPE